MKSKLQLYPIVICVVLALASCGDDPILIEKLEQQKSEISRLKGEIALVQEKLKNLPRDVSSELAQEKQLHAERSAQVILLEAEVADLDARKLALQKEFDAYRVRYQVR